MPPIALRIARQSDDHDQPLVGSSRSCGRCTDIFCCIAFVLALLATATLGAFGITHGNPDVLVRFAHGRDSQGRLCGKDDAVKDFKFTYYALPAGREPVRNGSEWNESVRTELKPVCTSKCPTSVAGEEMKNSTAREISLCPRDAVEAGLCAWYGGNTTAIAFYCVDFDFFTSEGSAGIWIHDLQEASYRLLAAPAVAILLVFFYMGFIHRCAPPCIWLSLVLSCVLPAALGLWTFHESIMKASGESVAHEVCRFSPEALMNISYGLWGISAVVALLAYCFAGTINAVIDVIRTTSDFLSDVPSQMFQPVLIGLAQLCCFCGWLYIFMQVASVGVAEGDSRKCIDDGRLYCVEWEQTAQRYGLAFLVLMLYVVLNFLSALSHYGTSYAVGSWYFADPDPETGRRQLPEGGHSLCDCKLSLRAFCSGLCCHPGSLAFGALFIALANVGWLLLFWAKKNEEALPSNPVTKCLRSCVNCLAACFTRFVEFVSEHAYVEVALRGQGFCASAKDALALAARQPSLFALIGRVAAAVRVVGVVAVVVGTVHISALALMWFPPTGLSSATAPLVVSGVAAFVVAEVVLHPLGAAARAVLHCYCIDAERARHLQLKPPKALATLVQRYACSGPPAQDREAAAAAAIDDRLRQW